MVNKRIAGLLMAGVLVFSLTTGCGKISEVKEMASAVQN